MAEENEYGIKRDDIVEIDFCAYKVLDVTERTLMVERLSDGSRKAVENTGDINILESKKPEWKRVFDSL